MLTVKVVSNFFGRPFKGYQHHWIWLRFIVTGGTGSYQFRRNTNNTPNDESSWQAWTDIKPDSYVGLENKDGYPIDTFWWHQVMPIQVRDKNNPSATWQNHSFEVFYNNQETGIPMGDTPIIVNTSIAAGDTTLTVKTAKRSSLVAVYKSTYSPDGNGVLGQNFQPLIERIVEGRSSLSGEITLTVPAMVLGERYCVTAQTRDDFESLASNWIEVGGAKKIQLTVNYTYGDTVSDGRMITVTSVTGGSGNYSIGLLNNGTFDKSVGTAFKIPFGFSNLFVKDNGSTDLYVSVAVDGGSLASGQTYTGSLRSKYSTSANPNGSVKFGLRLANGTFEIFNDFAQHDGRLGWGKAGFAFPHIGIEDSNLATNRILLHPAGNSTASGENYGLFADAAAIYVCEATGVINLKGDSVRTTQTSNPWANPPLTALDSRFQIIHNGNVIHEAIHTLQDIVVSYDLTFNVSQNDEILFIGDSYDLTDNGDNSFDHVHASASWVLAANGAGGVTPPTPTITSNTPLAIKSFVQGNGHKAGDYIVVYKDDFPFSLAILEDSIFRFGAMFAGRYKVKISRNKLLSDASNVVTVNEGAIPVPAAPVPDFSTCLVNQPITGKADQQGTIKVYKGALSSVIYATVTTEAGPNNTIIWSYTPTLPDIYKFKNDNGTDISGYSNNVVVSAISQNFITFVMTPKFIGSGGCGGVVEYAWSDTITDINSTELLWNNVVVLPTDKTIRFFARVIDNHAINFTSPLINTTIITENDYKTLWQPSL